MIHLNSQVCSLSTLSGSATEKKSRHQCSGHGLGHLLMVVVVLRMNHCQQHSLLGRTMCLQGQCLPCVSSVPLLNLSSRMESDDLEGLNMFEPQSALSLRLLSLNPYQIWTSGRQVWLFESLSVFTGGPEGTWICSPGTGKRYVQKIPRRGITLSQMLHVCHICRSVGVVWGVNVSIYGVYGTYTLPKHSQTYPSAGLVSYPIHSMGLP